LGHAGKRGVLLSIIAIGNKLSFELPKSEWKAPSFSYGDEHGGGFSHLEEIEHFCAIFKK
jgi:hypothetical protein